LSLVTVIERVVGETASITQSTTIRDNMATGLGGAEL